MAGIGFHTLRHRREPPPHIRRSHRIRGHRSLGRIRDPVCRILPYRGRMDRGYRSLDSSGRHLRYAKSIAREYHNRA